MTDTTAIDKVIAAIDAIMTDAIVTNSPLALFALVYKKTTERIKDEVQAGAFEDNARMVEFDVFFAQLYIDAYWRYKAGETVSGVWKIAFDQANRPLTFIQHIMLGMSAHINYDLAITTYTFAKGKDILALRPDFDRVNDILAGLTRHMQNSISAVSPMFFLVDWIGQNSEEKLINFSIRQARTQAFRTAALLHETPQTEPVLALADEALTGLAQRIIDPPGWTIRQALRLVRTFESQDMAKTIRLMSAL
jgi:Family of unknown function (DUF5995)